MVEILTLTFRNESKYAQQVLGPTAQKWIAVLKNNNVYMIFQYRENNNLKFLFKNKKKFLFSTTVKKTFQVC